MASSEASVGWVGKDLQDAHEALICACAEGRLSFEEFIGYYDNFYDRCALDGHESEVDGRESSAEEVQRIRLHERITKEILNHLTSDVLLEAPGAQEAGFIGLAEGQVRLVAIWGEHRAGRAC
jgi:hypothetical protein